MNPFEGSWILPSAVCVGILATFSIFAASLCYHQNKYAYVLTYFVYIEMAGRFGGG